MTTRGSIGRAATGLGLALASFAVALLLAEAAVRLTWRTSAPAGERRAPAPERREIPPEQRELPVYSGLWDLAQRNANGLFKGLPYRTNSNGIRGPEYGRRPAPGVFRIIVAGDSVTMGSGVREEDAYPALLERRLAARDDSRRYEVLNLGLAGLNTHSVVNRIQRTGLPYAPHLIVYGFTLNDIEGPAYRSTITPEEVTAKHARYLRFVDSPSYLLRAVWPRALALYDVLAKPEGSLEYDMTHNYFENPKAWQDVTNGLDKLARMGRETGVCVHMLIHTGTSQLNRLFPFLEVMEHVEQAARERGMSVTQSFPYFEGRDPVALRVSFFDTHPNAAGHEILADALEEGLRTLPESCWELD